jgi:alkaline phosphatase
VIFLVSDGMSAGVLPLAERFSKPVRGRGTNWSALLGRRDAGHGFIDMSSLNSAVSDSAAASSSWGSGSQVFDGTINTLPDGTALTPLARLAKDRGLAVGLVTTATVTHAIPAGFAASQWLRDEEWLIAPLYLGVVDVILGGGQRFFHPRPRKDGRDLMAEFTRNGFASCTHREQLRNFRPQKCSASSQSAMCLLPSIERNPLRCRARFRRCWK